MSDPIRFLFALTHLHVHHVHRDRLVSGRSVCARIDVKTSARLLLASNSSNLRYMAAVHRCLECHPLLGLPIFFNASQEQEEESSSFSYCEASPVNSQ